MTDQNNITEFPKKEAAEERCGDSKATLPNETQEALNIGIFVQRAGLAGFINCMMNIGNLLNLQMSLIQKLDTRLTALEICNEKAQQEEE